MKVLQASTLDDFKWIQAHAHCVCTPYARALKAIDEAGDIRGMVAFDNWTVNAVQVHMAVDTPIAWRSLLPAAFHFAFEMAGKGLVVGITPASNERALSLSRKAGFRQPYRIKDGWAVGEDMVVSEMRKDECRYLGGHHGRQ